MTCLPFAACAASLAVLIASQAGAQAIPPPIELRIPKAPTVARGDGRQFLSYEIHITNLTNAATTLKRIDVIADGGAAPIASLADTALGPAMARPGAAVMTADRPLIGAGLRAVVFMWVPLTGESPRTITHRFTFATRSTDSARTATVEAARVSVPNDAPVIGPPLRGGVWLAANGPSNESGHRRAMIPIDGTFHIAQRFAIDYVKMDEKGSTFEGDRLKNTSYYAYNTDALAVADGNVVAVKDGIPENIPGPASRAVPITLETVGGNHVIIDIGGGKYAFYAHLVPGSLRVKLGDRVKRGQVVGLVGNSGNSTEPHLHFHISDGNSPLGSEGLPYVHESLESLGRCRSLVGGCTRGSPTTARREMPMANALVRFP
jgi:hypothetical protein